MPHDQEECCTVVSYCTLVAAPFPLFPLLPKKIFKKSFNFTVKLNPGIVKQHIENPCSFKHMLFPSMQLSHNSNYTQVCTDVLRVRHATTRPFPI